MPGIANGQYTTYETRHPSRDSLALHRHAAPYVALVLEGGYEEFSVDGAWACRPGDLVVHPAWHLHANRFRDGDSRVLNFRPVRCGAAWMPVAAHVYRLPEPGRLLGRRRIEADDLLEALAHAEPLAARRPPSLPSRLGTALVEGEDRGIATLARRLGYSREHAARSFRRHVGMPPRAFRAEARLRRALGMLMNGDRPLSAVAHEAGYADQAHLTRCVRAATGLSPGELRRRSRRGDEITFVQ